MRFKKKVIAFLSTFTIIALWSTAGFAETATAGAASALSIYAWMAIASGIGMGIAVVGGALGQGRAVQAAMEGIARNPGSRDQVFVPFILGLALIESLVIYALVISFLIQGKIDTNVISTVLGG